VKVAILGGTFDPIHNAHLAMAREAMRHLNLDQVLFIPAWSPPHKIGSQGAAFEHRYRMVELACQGEPKFVPSRIEEGSERSYSIHTIELLKRQRPQDHFYFLIGADAFSDIETWHRWREVLSAIEFVVISRPGHDYDVPDGARVHALETLDLQVSSSLIREQLAAGGEPKVLPPAVLAYIREHGLYRDP